MEKILKCSPVVTKTKPIDSNTLSLFAQYGIFLATKTLQPYTANLLQSENLYLRKGENLGLCFQSCKQLRNIGNIFHFSGLHSSYLYNECRLCKIPQSLLTLFFGKVINGVFVFTYSLLVHTNCVCTYTYIQINIQIINIISSTAKSQIISI